MCGEIQEFMMLRFGLILVLISLWTNQAQGCGPYGGQGGSCTALETLLFTQFKVTGGGSRSTVHASTFYLDGEQSQIACKRRGMQLVEITSRSMFNSIRQSLDNINPFNGQAFLIAGRYRNGRYLLENGNRLPGNLEWHQGEPSRTNGRHDENCLVLERRSGQFRLNDVRCWDVNSRYLCEDTVTVTGK
ncbi:hypothetical protein RRG08_042316 [Elysia crispata]|uniref:C-type lectin domain-containing protein n=1 Tax=Elysia crispata TaxID=231223 RepID=A0AAE0ZM86_9GAST|nr:hypothetical protein RRG08_042316 [Elysia crispata]